MANSLPAFNNDEFAVTNSFPAFNKDKFGTQNTNSREFCKAKLGKQGFALRHKHEFVVTNSLPASKKYEFCAQDASAGLYVHASIHPESTAAQVAAEQNSKGASL